LLNPEIDEVEEHFYFLPIGEIRELGDRGKATIDILKLNRVRLVLGRKKLLDDNLNEIENVLNDFISKTINIEQCQYAIKQVFVRIILLQNPEMQYSRFGFFMFHKFQIFIANKLATKQREAILKLFELFKKGEL
jgi:hypothetical protein